MGRRGGGERVNVQNRSAGANRANDANLNRNNNANVNRNVNNNANVNRNVNVNQDINVNRNVNVNTNYHGGCYNCGGGYYHDDGWNWGSFAAGAAVGVATTAAVSAATRPEPTNTTVVVQAPAVGTMVPALPGGCSTISTGGAMIYNCSSVYYRPYYQGTTLVYQVVTYP
jgi:outer membrane usher protein FimD/PapC